MISKKPRSKNWLRAYFATCLVASVSLFSCAFAASVTTNPDDAFIKKETLFEVTPDGPYRSIRIPCLVALPDDSLLAFTSARSAVSDWAVIHILMRRSPDGGKTWEPAVKLLEDGKNVVDNPVAIWDAQAKVVHFLYQTNYERIWHMRSADGGKTFSKAVDITPQLGAFEKLYKWHVIAPGPGHGLQMKNGRLVVPVWLSPGALNKSGKGRAHRPSVTSVIYSDDNGKSWHCGDIVPDTLKNMNETVAVEADDGGVLLFIRNEDPAFRKAIARSKDGATKWTKPALNDALHTPICFASVLRISGAPGKSRILICNPDSRPKTSSHTKWGGRPRENLVVKVSYDDGRTWSAPKVIEPGRASYSDMAILSDGTIVCLYENGHIEDNPFNNRYMSVARFSLEWVTDGKDTLKKKK